VNALPGRESARVLHEKDVGRFNTVANVVGRTMQYHPHGDASIDDAPIALTNKRCLIEGQGNLGNISVSISGRRKR
jgi:topoisomerase IV subunit A